MSTQPETQNLHTLDAETALTRLGSAPTGLSETEVAARLEKFGPNELAEKQAKSPLAILLEQFTNPLVLLLIGAGTISIVLGKPIDSAAVFAIVIINAILGFVQEYRAERAMAALKKLSSPVVRVRRDGKVVEIASSGLVPGDILLIEAGNAVPADARVLEAANLRVQEAALTGESLPVDKSPHALQGENIPIGDRDNMLFMGTAVTFGRGVAVVTATGRNTELGRIADLIQNVKQEATPLQRRMAQLGRGLAFSVLAIVLVTFLVGLLRGEEAVQMFTVAVSMAVAAVPEGLPAVVTIVLALGAQRMLRRKALIRKLPAVETLGSVTVICSDKTGTLTENRMTVTVLDVADHTLQFEEEIRQGHPFILNADPPVSTKWPAHALLLSASALCNDAVLQHMGEGNNEYRAIGDPTEGALIIAAARVGLMKESLDRTFTRVAEVPFSSERRRMSTLHHCECAATPDMSTLEGPASHVFEDNSHVLFVKGGVDSLMEVSNRVWLDGQILPMDDSWRERIQAANNRLAQNGLRVLGIGYRPYEMEPGSQPVISEKDENDLILIGLIGMMDPPRAEVKDAVQTCLDAGIRPVMITGDHPLTALQIARMLKIVSDQNARVVTGQELSQMSQTELEETVTQVSVYARVSPENKLQIVDALQKRGH
ncbi:MAG: HAD-IC family P-type ATPase, partial [Anaerolineae bacterium]|nr:HAD-IC family P-type ATPase [Anaerolineae bacterium]